MEDVNDKKEFSDTMVCMRVRMCVRVRAYVCVRMRVKVCVPVSSGGHVGGRSVSGRSGFSPSAGRRNSSSGKHQLQRGEQLRCGGEPELWETRHYSMTLWFVFITS